MNNASKSQEALQITSRTDGLVKDGDTALKIALDSILKINTKIAVIKEIADKTDILSLNASIEASNAGESGKGFSVVAREIRKLADNSNKAAGEITELANHNITVSDKASGALIQMVDEIKITAWINKPFKHNEFLKIVQKCLK